MNILGIDPGVGGGICLISGDAMVAAAMPKTARDLLDLLRPIEESGRTRAYVEKVGTMPTDSARSARTFARNVAWIEMALVALGIPSEEVAPKDWQRGLALPALPPLPKRRTKGDARDTEQEKHQRVQMRRARDRASRDRKNAIKAEAQRRFPHAAITLATADAVMIAVYGARRSRGDDA